MLRGGSSRIAESIQLLAAWRWETTCVRRVPQVLLSRYSTIRRDRLSVEAKVPLQGRSYPAPTSPSDREVACNQLKPWIDHASGLILQASYSQRCETTHAQKQAKEISLPLNAYSVRRYFPECESLAPPDCCLLVPLRKVTTHS